MIPVNVHQQEIQWLNTCVWYSTRLHWCCVVLSLCGMYRAMSSEGGKLFGFDKLHSRCDTGKVWLPLCYVLVSAQYYLFYVIA